MITVGTVCMKIAGRDSGNVGVVVSVEGDRVLLDGFVRRRLCSLRHVEPLGKTVKVKAHASSVDVQKALESLGYTFPVVRTQKREKGKTVKPLPKRVLHVQERVAAKVASEKKKATQKISTKKALTKKITSQETKQ